MTFVGWEEKLVTLGVTRYTFTLASPTPEQVDRMTAYGWVPDVELNAARSDPDWDDDDGEYARVVFHTVSRDVADTIGVDWDEIPADVIGSG